MVAHSSLVPEHSSVAEPDLQVNPSVSEAVFDQVDYNLTCLLTYISNSPIDNAKTEKIKILTTLHILSNVSFTDVLVKERRLRIS